MEIRAWQEKDIESVALLEQACFSDPWTKEMLFDCLRYPHYRCFLAEEGGQVLGYCCMSVLFEDGELCNIATAKGHRGKGIAKALMEQMHAVALGEGATQMFLEVRKSNTPAISLYEKYGYRPFGVRPRYYGDGEDAILMKKLL